MSHPPLTDDQAKKLLTAIFDNDLDHAIGKEGERAICASCSETIVNTGQGFWDHVGFYKPHHFATPIDDLEGDCSLVLPYHEAPEDEPVAEPVEVSTWLEPQLNLRSSTSPRSAADQLRAFYTSEWIADLLVCLCSRTAFTESTDAA
jgi:hypothetical protein